MEFMWEAYSPGMRSQIPSGAGLAAIVHAGTGTDDGKRGRFRHTRNHRRLLGGWEVPFLGTQLPTRLSAMARIISSK